MSVLVAGLGMVAISIAPAAATQPGNTTRHRWMTSTAICSPWPIRGRLRQPHPANTQLLGVLALLQDTRQVVVRAGPRTEAPSAATWCPTTLWRAPTRPSPTPLTPPHTATRTPRASPATSNTEAANVSALTVHIGARVSALAGPNDVLVSNTLRDLVIGSGLEFEERGTHELKGVPGEWHLFAVASA